ncbi:MAG: type II secretion system secretin GspD [Oligoflexus sp.]
MKQFWGYLIVVAIWHGSLSAQTGTPTDTEARQVEDRVGADGVPSGQELVSIDFPEPTEIKDIIRAVALWTGKNVILGQGVNGRVQMISPRKVTKEEAYQAFLSALNVLGLTTVETGKVIKVMPTRNALRDNLRIYQGTSWAPRTDKLITHIVPLKYIDAREIQRTLSRIVSTNSMIAYQPTNTLIISDTGYTVRRVLQIIELLDVAGQQPQVALVPIRYGDAKSIASKVSEILKASSSGPRRAAPASGQAAGGAAADYRTFRVTVDERSNSVVVFGPPRTIEDVKALVKKFDFPVDDPQNQASIRVRFLDYADAKRLATTLSSLTQGGNTNRTAIPRRTIGQRRPIPGQNNNNDDDGASAVAMLSDNVRITADESANALLITGSRAAYESINTLIRKLDRRRAQVYVEADILDVNLSNTLNFGTSMILGSANGNALQSYGWQGEQVAPLIAAGSDQNRSLSDAQKLGIASALGKDFTIGVLSGQTVDIPGIGEVRPGGLITMLKADGNTRVLSSPHLLTSNNETAKIVVGDRLFFTTAQPISAAVGAGAIPKVEKEEADLSLEIKPNISHSGSYVTLKIDLEANEGAIDPNTRLPNINKRQTSQLVTVKNGQTAVVSGLVKRRDQETFQKIPLLGDIPILGWLFRNSSINKVTTSLMIFLTPHVVYGANDLAAIYEKKVQERDELMRAAFGSRSDDPFLSALPSQEAGKYRPTSADVIEERQHQQFLNELREDMGFGDETTAPIRQEQNGPSAPTTVPIPLEGGYDEAPLQLDGDFSEPPEPSEPMMDPEPPQDFDGGMEPDFGGDE